MITSINMNAAEHPDAQLVSASRAGDRSAFGQIVTRYQSLVCSVAYSGSGSLSLSEDVAQETFVAAWKQLEELREPEKLRAWLCGIARNVTRNTLRRLGREPVQSAESIEAAHELPALEKQPADHTMSREEEAILWRSLERIPDTYREPLVLFYREGQSVEQTAALLELSEDAVKQRLSRGRKLLAEEVAGFVEGALKSSAPGRAFTLGVLASLPILTTSAKAATLGAVAAKGSATAKAAAAAGVFNALLGAVLGFLGPWIQYRMFLDSAKSDRQREIIRAFYHKLFGCMLVFSVALVALIFVGRSFVSAHPLLYAGALICLVTTYVIAGIRLVIWAGISASCGRSLPPRKRTRPRNQCGNIAAALNCWGCRLSTSA
jgi:RNA polymerase sigma factor (sigma-70 family)